MIELVSHQPYWAQQFSDEKALLLRVLNDLPVRIEHIGSTAIPGIYAKPVIDILIGVAGLAEFTAKHIQKIESLGYRYQPLLEQQFPHRRFFQKDNVQGKRAYQIHLVNESSSWWQRHMLFRDYLRKHHDEAKQYEAHKLKLSQQFSDTKFYAMAKTDFCQIIGKKAYFDWNINSIFHATKRLNGYIPQSVCFDLYQKMFQNPTFVRCYGVQLSDDRIHAVLARDMDYWDQYGFGPLAWFDKDTDVFAGVGGLNHTQVEEHPEIELAYALQPTFWGQGYASEIGTYVINEAFQKLKLSHLVCFTLKNNDRSLRVMQKLNFQYERDFIHAGLPHYLYRLRNSH